MIQVAVTVTGNAIDRDGFELIVDSAAPRPMSAGGTTVTVAPGQHNLTLGKVQGNCTVADNPRMVDVQAGATLVVGFQIACVAGTLRLESLVTGEDQDPDGFTVLFRLNGTVYDRAGSSTLPRDLLLPAVSLTLGVDGLNGNCRMANTGRVITIVADSTVSARLEIGCTALVASGIVASDGERIYRLFTDGGPPREIGQGYSPSISADGQVIAFARADAVYSPGPFWDYEPGGFTMKATGDDVVQLQPRAAGAFPRFLPNGDVYQSWSQRAFEPDGSGEATLPWQLPGGYDVLDWTADLGLLLVVRHTYDRSSGNQLAPDSLALALPSGVIVRHLWIEHGVMAGARFSPDGQRVAVNLDSQWHIEPGNPYNFMCRSNCGVWVLPVQGGAPRRIWGRVARDFTPDGMFFDWGPLAWSPDGARLLLADYSSGRFRLFSVRSDDGGDRQDHWTSQWLPSADWR